MHSGQFWMMKKFSLKLLAFQQGNKIQKHVKFQFSPCILPACLCCDVPVLTAKTLVARLMEVDQDQRLTAQEAINHEW